MYYIKGLQGWFATDTLFADMRSLYRNTFCQVYSHKAGFASCYPQINAKISSLSESIDNFGHDFGALEHQTFDGFSSQVGKNTRLYKNMHKY